MQKELQAIQDAEDELILIDDDACIPCQYDDPSLFEKTKPEAETFLVEERTRIQSAIDEYDSKSAEYLKEIEALRTHLYGKLGNLVQLDNSGEDDDNA